MDLAGVPIGVLLAMTVLSGAVLAALAMVARAEQRNPAHAGDGTHDVALAGGDPEPGEIGVLTAHATTARAAADRAALLAQHAHWHAAYAAGACDTAREAYEAAERAALARGEDPQRLIQRAAVAAYRRGDLSVAQLDRLWSHAAAAADGAPPAPLVDPHDARREYELARAEAQRARHEAHVAEVAADALAAEAEVAAAEARALSRWSRSWLARLRRRVGAAVTGPGDRRPPGSIDP